MNNKIKHGLRYHYIYQTWRGMIDRCYLKTNNRYHRYGGRGIIVCDRWRHSVVDFYADILASIGDRPSSDHSIDRIDNDGNYEPGNVRWATRKEQAANRLQTQDYVFLTVNGETKSMGEWAKALGVSRCKLYDVLHPRDPGHRKKVGARKYTFRKRTQKQ